MFIGRQQRIDHRIFLAVFFISTVIHIKILWLVGKLPILGTYFNALRHTAMNAMRRLHNCKQRQRKAVIVSKKEPLTVNSQSAVRLRLQNLALHSFE